MKFRTDFDSVLGFTPDAVYPMEQVITIEKFKGALKRKGVQGLTREISNGSNKVQLTITKDATGGGYCFQKDVTGVDCWLEWKMEGPAFDSCDLVFTNVSFQPNYPTISMMYVYNAPHGNSTYVNACRVSVPEKVLQTCLVDDTLTIKCFVKLTDTAVTFLDLFRDGVGSDVLLQTESKEYQLHKCVVCPQSRVLEELIMEATVDNHSNIAIFGFSEKTVDAFVTFLYTCTLPGLVYDSVELWKMAAKYEVTLLQVRIDAQSSNLNEENCIILLHYAVEENLYYLKFQILQWILRHEPLQLLRANKTKLSELLGVGNTCDLIDQL